MSTRLVRGWTHLERQKGGIGLRGPGETQLEVDRRLIANRIKIIEKRLSKVITQRDTKRKSRDNKSILVSMVGYTNAGKSTLLNALTGANVYCQDQLFATLDTTIRKIAFNYSSAYTILCSDTVGIIEDIPLDLIDAFKSTLEDIVHADILLYVVDVSDSNYSRDIAEIHKVISYFNLRDKPVILVMNKSDRLDSQTVVHNFDNYCYVSSLQHDGITELKNTIEAVVLKTMFRKNKC